MAFQVLLIFQDLLSHMWGMGKGKDWALCPYPRSPARTLPVCFVHCTTLASPISQDMGILKSELYTASDPALK